jgi:outer membrane protein assembly factor BamA
VYTYNNLDYYYQYIKGFKSILYTQYVTSNNPFQKDFFITWNDFFYYKRVGDTGNWANRVRFGLSSNENTPFAPFALDNNVNLRGVGILVDRGTGSFVWNTEYRHTILDKNWLAIQTNIFTDMGSWRNPGGAFNDFFDRKNVMVYSGFGLRFISKKIYNATFRIDYGFRLTNNAGKSKGGLVFGIGQYF